jgi:endoglucanase
LNPCQRKLISGISQIVWFLTLVLLSILAVSGCKERGDKFTRWKKEVYGSFIRTDTLKKEINLVFTGHEFADGSETIRKTLGKHGIKASFFFTGDFYRNPAFSQVISTLVSDGHYLGAHSDKHLLYCSWENRDSLLVSRERFRKDLEKNYAEMARFGISKNAARFFLPPYEWYNKEVSQLVSQEGLYLVNFSPGTSSNQDWTYPELGAAYLSSDSVFQRILRYESKNGMNGFILLTHIGTDPRRIDKFYNHLDELLYYLKSKGYSFRRIDQ